MRGRFESVGVLRSAERNLRLADLKVGRRSMRTAFPEEGSLTGIVPRRQRSLVFPHAPYGHVVLEVLSDTGKVLHDRYSQPTQFRGITDTREHQHLWRVHRT